MRQKNSIQIEQTLQLFKDYLAQFSSRMRVKTAQKYLSEVFVCFSEIQTNAHTYHTPDKTHAHRRLSNVH